MKIKTLERAKRIFLSSLLRSDLTMTEIREISKAFLNDFDFSQDLGVLIEDVIIRMELSIRIRHTKRLIDHVEHHDYLFDKAVLLIRKRRIPKREITIFLKSLCPEMRDFLEQRNLTAREVLSFFFKTASYSQTTEFIEWLQKGSHSSDDYLKGIMRKT